MYLIKHIENTQIKYIGMCLSIVVFNVICKNTTTDDIENQKLKFYFKLTNWDCEKLFKENHSLLECIDIVDVKYTNDMIQLGTMSNEILGLDILNYSKINDNDEFEDLYDINSFIESLEKYLANSNHTDFKQLKSTNANNLNKSKNDIKSGLSMLKSKINTNILD